jgi:hypothetical protein
MVLHSCLSLVVSSNRCSATFGLSLSLADELPTTRSGFFNMLCVVCVYFGGANSRRNMIINRKTSDAVSIDTDIGGKGISPHFVPTTISHFTEAQTPGI